MKIVLGQLRRGPAGSAQEVLHQHESTDRAESLGTIGTWFLDIPGQAAAWRHFGLSAIHLRPIPGVKPAVIRVAGATHEFLLLALDPALKPMAADPQTWAYMRPVNVEEQVKIEDDATACKILAACAAAVVDGRLWAEPPLSGTVEPWRSTLKHWAEMPDHATL